MRSTAGKALLTVAVVVAAAAVGVAQDDRPLVQVSGGLVRGLNSTTHNVTCLEFLGIPFATPPLDELRFKDPLPAEPWEGELDASELPPPCNQLTVLGKEDCLYLSVYTPEDALTVDYPFPVMVYIHGGAFFLGGEFIYHGFQELVSRGLIVVVIQYRLGLFGFLSTEDNAAPGNQGLKDQTLALQWVQENIAAFGGDPTKVTIFGLSAGSASVHFQMLVPSAAGLFSGVIMESGNALMPWASGREFLVTAQAAAERFNCPTLPTDELVTCLQGVQAHLLDSFFDETFLYTERFFHIPHDWTSQLMSTSSEVYIYELNHRGEHSLVNQYLENGLDLPQAQNYVAHGDNTQYYMYPEYGRLNRTDDKLVGHYFTTMWSNFAKYGNPTPDDSLGFTWEMTEPTMLAHLTIVPDPFMETDQRTEARAFWESLPLRINDLLNQ